MARPELGRPRWLEDPPRTLLLTLGGRYAGEQVWETYWEKGAYHTHVHTQFAGVLPALKKVQHSQHNAEGKSYRYAEGSGGKPSFETIFDEAAGLRTVKQHAGNDEASLPLLVAHYDPVSLVAALRSPQAPTQLWRAPLVGAQVQVQPLEPSDLSGAPARGFYLRPGGAYVMVQAEYPYGLLRLVQPTDFGPLSADLPTAPRRSLPAERPKRRRVQP